MKKSYMVLAFLMNTILGLLGLAIGFGIFLLAVLETGKTGILIVVFGIGIVCLLVYYYVILRMNRWFSKLYHLPKDQHKKAMIIWMIYSGIVLLMAFAYSFVIACFQTK